MPAKEIKELRQAGKLDEAYKMAVEELNEIRASIRNAGQVEVEETDMLLPDGRTTKDMIVNNEYLWALRNLSWVIYSQLDKLSEAPAGFIDKLFELKLYNIPSTEEMLYENLSIVISKAARLISKKENCQDDLFRLFDSIKDLPLKKPSKWYSVLFKAFHKSMKNTARYIEFADWWDFENFMPEDFQKEKFDGKEIMSLAEQAYVAYSKHLLPQQAFPGGILFDKDKAESFLPKLDGIILGHPEYQYTVYYKSKLLLALDRKEEMKSAIIPFAKKKKNDFWVWELLGEAFSDINNLEFACYCKALDCFAPEEMLVNLRRKMAAKLIKRQLYTEARTEIDILLAVRQKSGYKVPTEIINWQNQEWYKNATARQSNKDLYRKHIASAEDLILGDIKKEMILVEFVNSDKKILNFIISKERWGFFSYERLIIKVEPGDVLLARLEGNGRNTRYRALSLEKTDQKPGPDLMKTINGRLRKNESAPFGFVDDVFIDPGTIEKKKLENGSELEVTAIMSFNKKKEAWGWKAIRILS